MNPVFLLSGTGTDVGKTHLAEALLHASAPRSACLWKPYESGVSANAPSDSERIARAAHGGWHCPAPLARFALPLAPPVAAQLAGEPLTLSPLLQTARALRQQHDPLILELAGGLLSPITARDTAIELAHALGETALILVARNRLGVLHDALAALTVAQHHQLRVVALLLSAADPRDLSCAHNEASLREQLALRFTAPPPLLTLPDAPARALAQHTSLRALCALLGLPSRDLTE